MKTIASLLAIFAATSCSGTETGNPPLTETSKVVVPAQGATLSIADAEVTIPPGSLQEPSPIRIYLRRLDAPIPKGFTGYSAMYEIVPDVNFAAEMPASVTLQISNATANTALYIAPTIAGPFESRGGQASGSAFTSTIVRSGVMFVGEPDPLPGPPDEPPEPEPLPSLSCTIGAIDTTSGTGHGVAIASTGNTVVAMYGEKTAQSNLQLHFASKVVSGSWSHQPIQGIPFAGLPKLDLAIDSDSNVHACYHVDDVNQGFPVAYLAYENGSWSLDVMGPQAQTNIPHCDIAVDETGAYVTYKREGTPDEFVLATNASGVWTSQEVSVDPVLRSVDLVRHNDTTYILHATRLLSDDSDLGILIDQGTSWTETLALDSVSDELTNQYDVNRVSLAIDTDGYLHVAYANLTQQTVNYTTNKTGAWVITPIDDIVPLYSGTADIAIDDNGAVHLAYVANADLHYATNKHGQWQTTLASGTADVDADAALTLDAQGKAHMIFHDWQGSFDGVVMHAECN